MSKKIIISTVVIAFVLNMWPLSVSAHPKNLLFPVIGSTKFSNDFTSPRTNGQHSATDIIASKGQSIVAAVAGTITYVPYTQPSWGYMITIQDDDGFKYDYVHMNNDTPGTDDGKGGPMNAYAPDMKVGNRVEKGQLLGYVGDSGNAENTVSHLHFEMTAPDDSKVNPYPYLLEAQRINWPVSYSALSGENLPYGPDIYCTTQIAAGNFDSDPAIEYVTAPGRGCSPHVKMFNDDDSPVPNMGFFSYSSSYFGGVDVAAGDVDGDGKDEIITGTGPRNSSHVRVFNTSGQLLGEFFAYPGYNTGVNVAAGDVDGDGKDEIITGTGPRNTSHLKVFEINGRLIKEAFIYQQYLVGVNVAAGDVDGDGKDEIVTAPGPSGGSHVKVFDTNLLFVDDFFAYPGFYGGVKVSAANVLPTTSTEEIVTIPYTDGYPEAKVFNGSGRELDRAVLYEPFWLGEYDVAAMKSGAKISTGGNRRSSVRTAFNL